MDDKNICAQSNKTTCVDFYKLWFPLVVDCQLFDHYPNLAIS